jgi:TolB-like protein
MAVSVRRIFLWAIPLFAVLLPCYGQADKTITVAVLDFVNIDGKTSVLGRYFSEETVHYLFKNSKLRLVERAQITRVTKEIAFHASGLISDSSAASLGNMLGADVVILGTLAKKGLHIMVNMRAIDVSTAAIKSTGRTEISGSAYRRMYNEILDDRTASADNSSATPNDRNTLQAIKEVLGGF